MSFSWAQIQIKFKQITDTEWSEFTDQEIQECIDFSKLEEIIERRNQ